MKKKFVRMILLLVISASNNFAKAQNTSGDSIFYLPVIHTIDIYNSDPNFWDSLVANYSLDRKIYCHIMLDSNRLMDSVGIQLKGNSSYNSMPGVKKSMKLSFNNWVSGQNWNGLKEVVLNNGFKDPTMMREKLMLDFMNRNNVYSPRCTYSKVYINGVYWGLYALVESVSANKFLTQHFNDKRGNLYKGDPNGTLQWLGSTPSLYYPKYELKTNTTQNNWNDLVELLDKINNSSTADFHDSVETILHGWSFINCWAANIIFANLDSYQGSGHNYYMYDDSLTNKFSWIAWDVNEAFGNFQMSMNTSTIENMSILYISNPQSNRPIEQKMLANAQYKQDYVTEICLMTESDFTTTHLYPIIDSLANRIRTAVYADVNKQYSNQAFEDNQTMDLGPQPGLKPFISVRRNALMNEMATYGCYLSVKENTSENNFILYPSPATDKVTIELPVFRNEINLVVTDMLGRTVLNSTERDNDRLSIDVSQLSNGVYTVCINNTMFRKMEVVH